jgi:hypothetical protein
LVADLEGGRQVRLEELVREARALPRRGRRVLAAVGRELGLDPLPDDEVTGVVPDAVALFERWTNMSERDSDGHEMGDVRITALHRSRRVRTFMSS